VENWPRPPVVTEVIALGKDHLDRRGIDRSGLRQ
jgi:hypothetical protein